ncbi:MAG: hypothetical protein AAGF11_40780 [Myxococcota bacterium]
MRIDSEKYFDEPAFFMGRLANLGFVIWHETPTITLVKKVSRTLTRLEQQPGQGFALIAVLTAKCAPIGAEIRSSIDDGMKTHRHAALGMAAIIEVPGVLGGLTRAIARTMSVVSRTPYPVNTYGSVEEAARWLPQVMASRGGPRVSARQIIDAVNVGRHRPD